MSNAKTVMSQASNTWAGPTYIEDVFSTYLYTGDGSTQTITNGIDLAGEGGLVWAKGRVTAGTHNAIMDTERGTGSWLSTNLTGGNYSTSNSITSFNSDGFSLGADGSGNFNYYVGEPYASWTFRKAPRFFDVVTYTGDGVAGREIAHNLGVEPGCIIVKRTNGAQSWYTYHRNLASSSHYLLLESTAAQASTNNAWNSTAPTDTVFTVGNLSFTNGNGDTYVAYLFAHDPLGPSGDGSDGLIACGSYTGTGAAGNFQDLGWEPQYVLVKGASAAGYNWIIHDVMRGMSETTSYTLKAESSGAENLDTPGRLLPRPTGFEFSSSGLAANNASGVTYIYIAIRRGPMRQPESGTEVFNPTFLYEFDKDGNTSSGNGIHGYLGAPTDGYIQLYRSGSSLNALTRSRLTGANYLVTSSTAAEVSGSVNFWDNNVGSGFVTANSVNTTISTLNFRRAPGFFDVVAYTGGGTFTTPRAHNLTVSPELVIVKARTSTGQMNWYVGHYGLNVYATSLTTAAVNNTNLSTYAPVTESTFVPLLDASGISYIAYLFATLPGVSKIGSYTGNGSSQTIDCGFTSGARFVLIKRTDSTGDWYVWDTARGIVAGNDPHLSLNTTAAEVTTDDTIDPDSSGFIVNQVSATNVNVSSASYIYLAIA